MEKPSCVSEASIDEDTAYVGVSSKFYYQAQPELQFQLGWVGLYSITPQLYMPPFIHKGCVINSR